MILRNINTNIILILILILINVACTQPPGAKEYWEIEKIPSSQQGERLAKFSAFPVEKQIDIYLYAKYYVERPSDSYLHYLADDGIEKIPIIVSRIDKSSSSDPRDRTALIAALDLIDLNCRCVAAAPGVLDILRKNTMPIDDQDSQGFRTFKRLYKEYLDDIESRKKAL